MSARRKKQRRVRDLRTLVAAGRITLDEADGIGAAHGLGRIGRPRPGRRRVPAHDWAVARAEEARACR